MRVCYFKLLSLGVICYVVMNNWNIFGREINSIGIWFLGIIVYREIEL